MNKISKRDEYEREFIQLIQERQPKVYGQRGKHTEGVDVLLFFGKKDQLFSSTIRCEIKTSIENVRYFNPKLQEQHNNYLKILKEFDIMTFYCFRVLSKKKKLQKKDRKGEVKDQLNFENGSPSDKWKVFKVDELPENNRKKPYLDIFNEKGMTITEFIGLFKELIKN